MNEVTIAKMLLKGTTLDLATGGHIILIGLGATLFMDIIAYCQYRLWQIPALNYAWVGRWVGHMAYGSIKHHTILQTPPFPGEKWIGQGLHYLIGILFAAMLIITTGMGWLEKPTLWPALTAGLISLIAPFIIMQPAWGFGIAARKTPHPMRARCRSLIAHFTYGIGLYLSAGILASLR